MSARRWGIRLLALCGIAALGHGLWIPVKAELAQVLLHRAWARTLDGESAVKPWPWADTWPTARLRSSDSDLIVLAGASGATMAFGPGHIYGTATPGSRGHVALAAHRDTHFQFLKDLLVDARIELEGPNGARRSYRVEGAQVVHKSQIDVLDGDDDRLTLVTCYPFDAVTPGGPLRYVVTAVAES